MNRFFVGLWCPKPPSLAGVCPCKPHFEVRERGPQCNETTLPGSPASEGRRLHNGEDEERYIEAQVLIKKGSKIGGINDTPEDIGFLGYLFSKLPEEKIKERMDYFKDQAKQLMKIRESGHLPDDKI